MASDSALIFLKRLYELLTKKKIQEQKEKTVV